MRVPQDSAALGLAAFVVVNGASLVLLAPVLPAWLSGAAYAVGSLVCHQRPDRSFHWGAAQLPVCARCTGIYAGAALAAVALTLAGPVRARGLDAWWRAGLIGSAMLMGGSVLLEWAGWWAPSHAERALTGVMVGAAGMSAVAFALVHGGTASRVATVHYR
jgi:uncharacterized membrane protein